MPTKTGQTPQASGEAYQMSHKKIVSTAGPYTYIHAFKGNERHGEMVIEHDFGRNEKNGRLHRISGTPEAQAAMRNHANQHFNIIERIHPPMPKNFEKSEPLFKNRYEDVAFVQGDDAKEHLDRIHNEGPHKAMQHLKDGHYPGEHATRKELPHGRADDTHSAGGYHLSYNHNLGYVGLSYDTKHGSKKMKKSDDFLNRTDQTAAPDYYNKDAESLFKSWSTQEPLNKAASMAPVEHPMGDRTFRDSPEQEAEDVLSAVRRNAHEKLKEKMGEQKEIAVYQKSDLDKALDRMNGMFSKAQDIDKTTHAEAKEMAGKKGSKKIGTHTRMNQSGKDYAVKYHDTNVVTIHHDDTHTLDSGGWKTATTKKRMNQHLPSGARVSQSKGEWSVHDAKGGKHPFKDKMRVDSSGTPVKQETSQASGESYQKPKAAPAKKPKSLEKGCSALDKAIEKMMQITKTMPNGGKSYEGIKDNEKDMAVEESKNLTQSPNWNSRKVMPIVHPEKRDEAAKYLAQRK